MSRHTKAVDGGRWRVGGLLSLLLALTSGCTFPGEPSAKDEDIPRSKEKNFAKLFSQNCSGCHGAEGKYGPAPPINDPLFVKMVTAEDIEQILMEGRKGTLMPAFSQKKMGPLTDEQIKIVAKGIKSEWQGRVEVEDIPPYHADSKSGDATAGGKVWDRACASCHGLLGKAEGMKINDPTFLNLVSDQFMRRIIITGRPDLGMPNFAETDGRGDDFKPLTSKEVTDLVALLRSWRQVDD